jgi:hypothetical protein
MQIDVSHGNNSQLQSRDNEDLAPVIQMPINSKVIAVKRSPRALGEHGKKEV